MPGPDPLYGEIVYRNTIRRLNEQITASYGLPRAVPEPLTQEGDPHCHPNQVGTLLGHGHGEFPYHWHDLNIRDGAAHLPVHQSGQAIVKMCRSKS